MLKMPPNDSVQLQLSILAALDDCPSRVDRSILDQPQLPEHREEGGEERSGKAGIQQTLDLRHNPRRVGPLG